MRQLKISKKIYTPQIGEDGFSETELRIKYENRLSAKEKAKSILERINNGFKTASGVNRTIIESNKYTDPEYTDGELISGI